MSVALSRSHPANRKVAPQRSTAAIDVYFGEISKGPLLSEAEEYDLACRAQTGDEAAIQSLVSRNLRFVVSVAKRFQHRGLGLDDLIAEGNVGLLAAVHRFDPGQGVRFITYAVWWVRQAILVALTKQTRLVRLPASRVARNVKVSRARDFLRNELGREPATAEIARHAQITPDDVEQWRNTSAVQISLDAPPSGAEGRNLSEQLTVEPTAEELAEDAVRVDALLGNALRSLLPREAMILRRYFGLGGSESQTLDVLAREMGITRERVRQLRDRALGKLRHGKYAEALASLTR